MRKYRVLFIDDERENTEKFIGYMKEFMQTKDGIEIDYVILSDEKSISRMNELAADVVLFDCAFLGSDVDLGEHQESAFGIELMKRFRKRNKRTKIIFYSGGFKLKGTECYEFVNEEILELINDIHIYKMIPKEIKYISEAILEAIEELDSVTMGLEDLKEEYESLGNFLVEEKKYTISDMITELKNGTPTGNSFREEINKMILLYLMKFGGEEGE